MLVARGHEVLKQVVARIRGEGGVAHGIVADLGDKRAIHRIAAEAAEVAGRLDGLINAASTLGPTPLRGLLDTECEDLERVVAVNLVGPFRLTRLLLGPMVLRDVGVVVNISSDAAVQAYPGWGAYGVSKAGLDLLSRIWATELEASRVRILSVDPGEMDTRMHADAVPDADRNTLANPAEVARRIASMIRDPRRAPSGARLEASRWEVTA